MPRQLSASSALQAVAAAVLVIGVLLLLVVAGSNQSEEEDGHGAGSSADAAESSTGDAPGRVQDVSGLDLPGRFEPIPAEEFFSRVTDAQRRAGSWRVVSTAETGGSASTPANQDVVATDDGIDVRISMQGSFGPVEARWIDEVFYVKGLTPGAKPWLRPSADGRVGQLLERMVAYSDPAQSFGALSEPAGFRILGVEDTDAGKAVHYRISIDPAAYAGQEATEGDSIVMDMWVDQRDRPVQVITVSDIGGSRVRTTLLYAAYGQELELRAPPARLTTTKLPPRLRG